MRKISVNLLSAIVVLTMVFVMIPCLQTSASTGVQLDILDGTITLSTGNTYTQGGTTGTYSDSITITGTSGASRTIVVESGEHNIILSDVSIEVRENSAFVIKTGASANITLVGENVLTVGSSGAGLEVQTGAAVIIDGEGSLESIGGFGAPGIGSSGTITIKGGTITAQGGSYGAGIWVGSGGTITIEDGTVTATGGMDGAGIGGGYNGDGGTIAISGGTVTATGGMDGAGIGGGYNGAGGEITITGGTVTATGGYSAAGIGGGYNGSGGTITITGGTVTATAGYNGAGIGGGRNGDSDTITISGGTVTATGGYNGAGIGGGYGGTNGTFLTGESGNAFINASSISDRSDESNWSGVIFIGDSGAVYGSITLETDVTILSGKTLAISDGTTLTIDSDITLINNGIINNYGTITNNGTIVNNESINNYSQIDSGYGEFIGDIPVDETTGTYIAPYSKETQIIAFEIANQVGDSVIDTDNFTVTVTMPYGTDVTALVSVITVSDDAAIDPTSETSTDFTNTVTYTVTAENDKVTQDWEVTVVIEVDPDIAIVQTASANAENANYANPMDASDYADESALVSYIAGIAKSAIDDDTVTVTVNTKSYTADSYTFTITVTKGIQSVTTTEKTVTIPTDDLEDTGGDTGGDTSGDTSEDTSGDTSGDTTEDTSEDTSGDTTEDTSEDTSGDTSEDTDDVVPETGDTANLWWFWILGVALVGMKKARI